MFKKLLSFLILTVFVLAACRPEEQPNSSTYPKPTPKPETPTATVTISGITAGSDAIKFDSSNDKLTINFTDAEGSLSFKINASDSWTVKATNDRADSWLNVSPASGGKGETTVIISAKANDTYDDRSADLDIICGSVKKSVRVVQKQKDAILISDTKAEVGAEGGDLKIELQHNIDYKVEISDGADWIRRIDTKGLSKATILFAVEPNDGSKAREGKISVISSTGSETVTVYQEGAIPYIVVGQKEYNVDSNAHQIEILVTSNTTVSLSIEGSEWLRHDQTKATSTDKYVFNVSENTDYDPRTGRIIFYADNGLQEEVVVNQSALGALIIAADSYEVPSEGGDYSFELSTNLQFSVSASASWIHIIETKGLSRQYIHFSVDENAGIPDRQGKIVVSSGSKTQEILIVQAGLTPQIIISQKEYNVDSAGHQIEVYVTRNTPVSYRIEGSDWIESVQTKASTTDKYVFSVRPNTDYDPRTGKIIFYADNGLQEEVVVNQSALGALIIAADSYEVPSEGGDYSFELSTNLQFSVSASASWIHIIETKGLSRQYIHFSVDENPFVHARIGMIDIYTDDNKSQSVTITQKGIILDYSPVYSSMFFDSLPDATKEKITTCNFIVNSDKTTEIVASAEDVGGYPAYLEVSGTVLNCYTKGSYYHVYGANKMFAGWRALKSVKFTAWDFSDCYSCSEMFSGCSSLESLDLNNIRNTGEHLIYMYQMFLNCSSLRNVDFSGWETSKVEDMTGVFQDCKSLESVNLRSFDTSKVFSFGYMFSGCESLKTVDLSSFRTQNLECVAQMFANSGIKGVDLSVFDFSKVYDYVGMFQECYSLESLDLSYMSTPAMTDARYIFSLCENLRSLDIRNFDFSKVPLDMFNYILQGVGKKGTCTISVNDKAFRRLQRASDASFRDLDINWNVTDLHHSSDMSKDGKVVKLQSAARGNGIDIVLMGDSYSDISISEGYYEKDMRLAMDGFFMLEPYKSLRDHFNVYMLYVVSDTDLQSKGGKLNVQYTTNTFGDTYITGDSDRVLSYVRNALPSVNPDNVTVAVVSNARRGGGTAFMDYPTASDGSDYGQGFSVAYLPRQFAETNFKYVLAHEMGGHGFAKLADEYSYSSNITISDAGKQDFLAYEMIGWYKNVSLATGPIKWQKFLDDSRYSSQNLGAYPGGFTYTQSFYSPTYDGVMGSSTSGQFNAPSREAIYYRINKLAYGDSWKYDYENFVKFDLQLNHE